MGEDQRWRRCSTCKKDIAFGADHYVCNVSTCNRRNSAFVFCTVSCWDGHLGIVRHRESWAVEAKAPTREEVERDQRAAGAPAKRAAPKPKSVRSAPASSGRTILRRKADRSEAAPEEVRAPDSSDELPRDTLIVASKLKQYVKAKAGINCSDRVLSPLSDAVRRLCDEAIEKALADERKTLLERDFD